MSDKTRNIGGSLFPSRCPSGRRSSDCCKRLAWQPRRISKIGLIFCEQSNSDEFVKSLVTPLCGAVSSNNFGEVIWKSSPSSLRRKPEPITIQKKWIPAFAGMTGREAGSSPSWIPWKLYDDLLCQGIEMQKAMMLDDLGIPGNSEFRGIPNSEFEFREFRGHLT